MAIEGDTLPLVRTKLYRPRITGDLVPRRRLLRRLNHRRNRPLILVVAPAGYGKTTLVASWLATCDWPNAWLSLDENDSDLALFLRYFLAAIRTLFPSALEETAALLSATSLPPWDILAHSLINDLDQIEQPFVLVLDDYHAIQNMDVHNLLDQVLRHPPPLLHLVLISRTDPPLSLGTLRAHGQATEIRIRQLRFTEEETTVFLQRLGMSADEKTVQALVESVEGWVTGLRLAVLASRHMGSERLLPAGLRRGTPYVADYLVSEILASQPPAIQDYMLATSILDRFCAPLCEAVCPTAVQGTSQGEEGADGMCGVSGEEYLAWLEAGNLFVVPLDGESEWYRYHHLFRQFLRDKLQQRYEPGEIASFHARASAWFAQNGLIDEAFHHALAAGDEPGAAQLVEQSVPALLSEHEWHLLEKWLEQLPQALIRQRPRLLLARAWVLYYRFAQWAIPPLLEALEPMLDESASARPVKGESDFFWGQHWYWQGRGRRSRDLCQRALDQIPETHPSARTEANLYWALSSQMLGQSGEATQRLTQSLGQLPLSPAWQVRRLGALVFVHFLDGELMKAGQVLLQIHELALKSGDTYLQAWSSYLQGFTHYYWNDLDEAVRHFTRAAENRYLLHSAAAIDSLAGLALAAQAAGRTDQAGEALTMLLEFVRRTNNAAFLAVARSCQAHLALLQGDLDEVIRWSAMINPLPDPGIMFYWLEVPRITRCRVLIAQGTTASLQSARRDLAGYRRANETQHNVRQLLDILVLQSLVSHKLGDSATALDTLERAVRLAEPGGWVRPFVEPGPEMADLLQRLKQRTAVPNIVGRVLAAFPRQARSQPEATLPLIEPLTNREMEILALLAQRLTNKEIARRLVISPGTVRQHTHNIYQKLDVKGRRQAVDKAVDLGILSPP